MLAFVCPAQYVGNITLATNRVAVITTNSTAGTGWYVGSAKTCTVFASLKPVTNNAAAGTAGTGTFSLTFDGSPDKVLDTAVFYYTTNRLTVTMNIINTVTNYITFDISAFQWLRVAGLENTATNLIATNLAAKYLLK